MHAQRKTSLALTTALVLAIGTHARGAEGRQAGAQGGWRTRLSALASKASSSSQAAKRVVLRWEADFAMPRHEVESLVATDPAVRSACLDAIRAHREAHPFHSSPRFRTGGLLAWTGALFAAAASSADLHGSVVDPDIVAAWTTFSAVGVRWMLSDRLLPAYRAGLRAAAIAAVSASEESGSEVVVSQQLRGVVALLKRSRR